MVKVRINGRTYSLSMEEFTKLLIGMSLANPIDVLDMAAGNAQEVVRR
ncbi:MAG: hypothetical protein M0Z61_04835 [Nitrospiraceae bacterium]|nr:hypothetical protein [Nitrospiraceae bacterium]